MLLVIIGIKTPAKTYFGVTNYLNLIAIRCIYVKSIIFKNVDSLTK